MRHSRFFSVSILCMAFAFLTGLLPQPVFSAAGEEEDPSQAPSARREETQEKKAVAAFGEMSLKEHRIFINPDKQDELRFVPNAPLILTLGTEVFSNEIVLRFPLQSRDPEGRDLGDTDYFSIQSTQRFKSAEFRVYYERYEGFYINNILTPTGNFFIFPDMASKRQGVEASYLIGYPPRNELFSRFEAGSDHVLVKWGGSLGLLYDETVLRNIPQNSAFPGGAGAPFSDAEMTTIAPRVGALFMIMGDLEGRLARPALVYWDTSFSVGYGDTRLDAIDRGQAKNERLKTIEPRVTLDTGIRQGKVFAGVKVSTEGIILTNGGDFEFDSFALGLYAGSAF